MKAKARESDQWGNSHGLSQNVTESIHIAPLMEVMSLTLETSRDSQVNKDAVTGFLIA